MKSSQRLQHASRIDLFSPAKVNLFFRVLAKRPDGFHEIASLYQAVSLGDHITIFPSDLEEDTLTVSSSSIPIGPSNLVLRASTLFRQKTGLTQKFSYHLDKEIPIESGLGGGSSNAATILWGLNQWMGGEVEEEELARWGGQLGSDVPFFFSGGMAYCQGKGELFTPLSIAEKSPFWIVKPIGGLSTAQVYQEMALSEIDPSSPIPLLDSHIRGVPQYRNDLEGSAFRLMPSLKKLKEELLAAGCGPVFMTGSGSACVCLGKKPENKRGILVYQVGALKRGCGSWY